MAQAVRDYISDGPPEYHEPWALRLARDCRLYGQWPREGDWFSQNDDEMNLMRIALNAEHLYLKQKLGIKWRLDESEMIDWIEEEN